jgi:two-component system CheB/CheR fusion protein
LTITRGSAIGFISINSFIQSASEKRLAANEELESTNDELQVIKEELQLINEKLATINAELQNKALESTNHNNDMNNLVVETGIAVIYRGYKVRYLTLYTQPN